MKLNYIFIGELKVNEDLTKNKELLKKFQEIDGIIFKAKHVFSWDPELMKIIKLIKGTSQSLTSVKQANNWADKTLSNLHYHFPY